MCKYSSVYKFACIFKRNKGVINKLIQMTITGGECVGSGVESRWLLMYLISTLEPVLLFIT